MNPLVEYVCLALAGYGIGSIPFGVLVARLKGIDVTRQGSGNIGATNVGRLLGFRFGILVFVLDFAKGALPVAGALLLAPRRPELSPIVAGVVAGLAAFLGHLFSVFLRFRGGKGVATGAGVVFVLMPMPTLAAVGTWIVFLCVFRMVSLASLAAGGILFLAHLAWAGKPFAGDELILTVFCALAVGLVVVRHRANIGRLLRGSENRFSENTAMQLATRMIHVLAVGMWFGMSIFFSFTVALSLFGAFEAMAQQNGRPSWFPLPPDYKVNTGVEKLDLQKDQGTRAAGFAISPLFVHYFLLQGICGFLATITALGWSRVEPERRVHRIRVAVLIVAFLTVLIGWPLERKVGDLRDARNAATDRLIAKLKTEPPTSKDVEEARAEAVAVRHDFTVWHLWSLLLNMITIVLVAVAMAQTAFLPEMRRATSSQASGAA